MANQDQVNHEAETATQISFEDMSGFQLVSLHKIREGEFVLEVRFSFKEEIERVLDFEIRQDGELLRKSETDEQASFSGGIKVEVEYPHSSEISFVLTAGDKSGLIGKVMVPPLENMRAEFTNRIAKGPIVTEEGEQLRIPSGVYTLNNTIAVVSGSMLCIDPGVTLSFGEGSGLHVEGLIEVNGETKDGGEVNFHHEPEANSQGIMLSGPNIDGSKISHANFVGGRGVLSHVENGQLVRSSEGDNRGKRHGGAFVIANAGEEAVVSLSHVHVRESDADFGAVAIVNAGVKADGITFIDNTAEVGGSFFINHGRAEVDGLLSRGNDAQQASLAMLMNGSKMALSGDICAKNREDIADVVSINSEFKSASEDLNTEILNV